MDARYAVLLREGRRKIAPGDGMRLIVRSKVGQPMRRSRRVLDGCEDGGSEEDKHDHYAHDESDPGIHPPTRHSRSQSDPGLVPPRPVIQLAIWRRQLGMSLGTRRVLAFIWHGSGTQVPRGGDGADAEGKRTSADLRRRTRAGDGNRTRMASLEGWGSAIELHPRASARGSGAGRTSSA